MILRILFNGILIYLIAIGGDALNSQILYPQPHQNADSTLILDSTSVSRTNSLKSDLLRSAAGTAIGGLVGAAVGGFTPILFGRDYDKNTFPDNSFYLSSYIGASYFAALSSSAVLYLSKNRDISYWRLAGYSLLPPMVLVLPLSIYASSKDREELVRSTWGATMASIGITAIWNVFVYRMHPLKSTHGLQISFGKLFPYRNQTRFREPLDVGVAVVEIRF